MFPQGPVQPAPERRTFLSRYPRFYHAIQESRYGFEKFNADRGGGRAGA
jgi:hypothetical protein